MATGQEAIERVAEVVDLSPTTVFRTAKAMREASQGSLWPQSSRGGGRGAIHVEPCHLVNLVLAVAANGVVTDAPRFVPFYRALTPNKPEEHVLDPDRVGGAASLLARAEIFSGQQSLGTALDQLVDLLTRDGAVQILEKAGLYVELFIDRLPRARVGFTTFDVHDAALDKVDWLYTRPATASGAPYWNFLPPRRIERQARIPADIFTNMASLWSDTKQHVATRQTRRLPVSASASANPEYKTAATLPGAAAALRNQPYTDGERPGRQTTRKLGEREKLSKQSVAALPEE